MNFFKLFTAKSLNKNSRCNAAGAPLYIYLKVFSIMLMVTVNEVYSGELCSLKPDNFDNQRESIQEFEQNIEDAISEIYQKEHPRLIEKLRQLEELKAQLSRFTYSIAQSHFHFIRRHHKNPAVRKQKIRQSLQDFLDLIEQNIQSEEEWEAAVRGAAAIRYFSFEQYRRYAGRVHKMQADIEELNNIINPLKAPYLLYAPKFNYSIRSRGIAYGDLQLEAFFRPPKDNLFKLPFLNIGFETNKNTVIYACIHLDSFDSSKNLLYVYFLSAAKLNLFQWQDIIFNPSLLIHSALNWRKLPQALIAPLPFKLNPAAGAVGFAQQAQKQLSSISQFSAVSKISKIINQLEIINFTAQVHPALKFVLDNVDFGIKGVLIQPDRVQIRYAGSILYGLINFNLAKYSQKADFSSFMNILTWNEGQDESSSELLY